MELGRRFLPWENWGENVWLLKGSFSWEVFIGFLFVLCCLLFFVARRIQISRQRRRSGFACLGDSLMTRRSSFGHTQTFLWFGSLLIPSDLTGRSVETQVHLQEFHCFWPIPKKSSTKDG